MSFANRALVYKSKSKILSLRLTVGSIVVSHAICALS